MITCRPYILSARYFFIRCTVQAPVLGLSQLTRCAPTFEDGYESFLEFSGILGSMESVDASPCPSVCPATVYVPGTGAAGVSSVIGLCSALFCGFCRDPLSKEYNPPFCCRQGNGSLAMEFCKKDFSGLC